MPQNHLFLLFYAQSTKFNYCIHTNCAQKREKTPEKIISLLFQFQHKNR